jgi:phosphopantetheinyl transferase
MAGDPVNVDVNIIRTTTHEEHVAALFQTPTEAE